MVECYTPLGLLQYWTSPTSLSTECLAVLESAQTPTSVSILEYLKVFSMTCLLEWPFYALALKGSSASVAKQGAPRPKASASRILGILILANLCTHPFVYFVFPWLLSQMNATYVQTCTLSEIFAPTVEAWLLTRFGKLSLSAALGWSVAANLASWWMGLYLT